MFSAVGQQSLTPAGATHTAPMLLSKMVCVYSYFVEILCEVCFVRMCLCVKQILSLLRAVWHDVLQFWWKSECKEGKLRECDGEEREEGGQLFLVGVCSRLYFEVVMTKTSLDIYIYKKLNFNIILNVLSMIKLKFTNLKDRMCIY